MDEYSTNVRQSFTTDHQDQWIIEFNRSKDLEATALHQVTRICVSLMMTVNGDDDDDDACVGDDDDDDEIYPEDKEANSELQTKVITAIDN